MPNYNPTTGVRYGVIAINKLDPDLADTLFYGSQATNVSEEGALVEAKAEAGSDYEALIEKASISAAESGADREGDFDSEAYEERWFENNGHEYDKETYVEMCLDRFNDRCCGIEEPTISGVYEGVTYQIGWLGGAPLLWVIEGPTGNASSLCSPCVPGAAYLDSGFVLDSELEGGPEWAEIGVSEFDHENGFHCYCVPRGWVAREAT